MRLPILFLFCSLFIVSQSLAQDESGHFLVEFDSFSPPTKELISSFENSKAAPFLAPDIIGKEQFLGDYVGKIVVIWFWNADDALCNSQISQLNGLQNRHKTKMQVISFGDQGKEALISFTKNHQIDFPVIANGSMLGEAAFGGDLGAGRLFLIDANGVIQKVIPREAFESNITGAFKYTEDMINSL